MNDPLIMSRFESLSNLQGHPKSLLHRNWTLCDSLRQRRALHQFQHQRPNTIRFLQPVDHADVGMIERGQDFRFSLKLAHALPISGKLLRQDLQRHLSTQPGVGGLVDGTHSAFAELGRDPVVVDALSDHGNLWSER